MSETRQVLELIELIDRCPMTTQELMEATGIPKRTLTRRIAEARRLGAQIETRRIPGKNKERQVFHCWGLFNAPEVRNRLYRWLELERSQTLIDVPERRV